MHCKKCLNDIPDESRVCIYCGTEINTPDIVKNMANSDTPECIFSEENDRIALLQQYVGMKVNNMSYGQGCIRSIIQRSDGKYYVTVFFDDISESEKSFLASTAFSKNVLLFENVENNRAITMLLETCTNANIVNPGVKSCRDVQSSAFAVKTSNDNVPKVSRNEIVNLLVESVLNNESIALNLISLYDDDEFENELYSEAFAFLEKAITESNISAAHKACVAVALSMIALKNYDGDLHSYIESKYREFRPETQSTYSKAVIQKGVYNCLGEYRDRAGYFDPRSYVAVPIVFCCVPHHRVKDLFKLSYDIYKKKLLFDEDVTDEQIAEKVEETFIALRRKDLINDSDTIKGTNYLMSKYTQSCIFSGNGLEALTKIVAKCIRLIILHLTRPEDSFAVETYYAEGYASWVEIFDSDEKEKDKYETTKTGSQPYLKLENNEVHLITGKFFMDDSYDPNDVHILVYNGKQLLEDIHVCDPNAIEFAGEDSAMSGYIVDRQEIVLSSSPLGELFYTVECSGDELYNSKNRLWRTNIFFDGKGSEVNPGTNYIGELFVITHNSATEQYGNAVCEVCKGDQFFISIVEVNDREVFYFDDEPYIFFKISSSQLISYSVPWADFVSFEKKKYSIYNDITILFPASCDKEDICIEVDGNTYYYGEWADISFSIRLYSKEHDGTWIYKVKIKGILGGYHNIRIINAVSGKQIKGAAFKIIYDPKMWKSFVSKDSVGITYEIFCSFFDSLQFLYEFGVAEKLFPAFVKNLGYGNVVVQPTSISYSIDGSLWHDVDDSIALYEISESIKAISVCGPSGMAAYIIDNKATVKKQALSLVPDEGSANSYKLYLSYIRTLQRRTNIRVQFEFGNRVKFALVRYNPFVRKDECKFFFDKGRKMHVFDIRFDSGCKLKAEIKPLHSNEVIASRVISNGELIELPDDAIDKNIQSLCVSLHSKKYGALFEPFQEEAFIILPKYDLCRPKARLTTFPPEISIVKNVLTSKVDFEGVSNVKFEIIPTGKDFKTPILSKVIHSGDTVLLPLLSHPFNSYKIQLFSSIDETGEIFSEVPFYVSKPVKVVSPFLQQTLSISTFILKDGSKLNVNYGLRCNTIIEVKGKYYMTASIMKMANKVKTEDIIISVKSATTLKYEVNIWLRRGNKLTKLRLNSGGIIESAVINKLGGMI